MPSLFRSFNPEPKDGDLGALKLSIESCYAELEAIFERLSASPRRLKPLPKMPLPTLAAPYEFAAIQALRALCLAEASVLLIEEANWAAVFPVLRALFEVWIALLYAEIMFRRLAVDRSRWRRYDEISTRLLRGRTAVAPVDKKTDPNSQIIYVGNMLDEVSRVFGESSSEAAAAIKNHYAELSDYTHPTIWSLVFNMEPRSDGLGTTLLRRPSPGGLLGPMSDLDLILRRVVSALADLQRTADDVDQAFRAGPATEEINFAISAQALEALLANPPELSEAELAIFRERGTALLAHSGTCRDARRGAEL